MHPTLRKRQEQRFPRLPDLCCVGDRTASSPAVLRGLREARFPFWGWLQAERARYAAPCFAFWPNCFGPSVTGGLREARFPFWGWLQAKRGRSAAPCFAFCPNCFELARQFGQNAKRPLSRAFYLAERGGFEPPVQFNPYGSLANYWFKPLTHLSKWGGKYSRRFQMVIPVGFEPTTASLEGRCSIHLSYGTRSSGESRDSLANQGIPKTKPMRATCHFALRAGHLSFWKGPKNS